MTTISHPACPELVEGTEVEGSMMVREFDPTGRNTALTCLSSLASRKVTLCLE